MKFTKRIYALTFCIIFVLSIAMFSACSASSDQPTASLTGQTNEDAVSGGIEKLSYSVSIDVNPSIELKIVNGVVAEVIAYNDDGQNIVLNTAVAGLSAEEAVKAIVKELVSAGYIVQGEIEPCLVIAVNGDGQTDTEIADKLQECAKEVIRSCDVECNVRGANVTDDISTKAAELGLSAGRYMILNYIVEKEGITMEQAIQMYGSLKIGELMNMFEGVEDIFKGEDSDNNGELNGLTDEQTAVLNPAFETLKKEIKQAEKAFHETFSNIKKVYTKKLVDIKKQYKNKDVSELKEVIDNLRKDMLNERQAALNVLNEIVNKARDKFKLAVSGLNIPEDRLDNYLNWHLNKEINLQDNLKDFLKDFYCNQNTNDNKTDTNNKNQNNNGNKINKGNAGDE